MAPLSWALLLSSPWPCPWPFFQRPQPDPDPDAAVEPLPHAEPELVEPEPEPSPPAASFSRRKRTQSAHDSRCDAPLRHANLMGGGPVMRPCLRDGLPHDPHRRVGR
jgi:hypothetical protein